MWKFTKEKVWEAEKCPPPPQDIHFLIPAISDCHLIQNGMIGSNKVKDLGRRSLCWIIWRVLKAITGILTRRMHRRSDRHTQRKEENLKAKAEAGVTWPQVKGRPVATRS